MRVRLWDLAGSKLARSLGLGPHYWLVCTHKQSVTSVM